MARFKITIAKNSISYPNDALVRLEWNDDFASSVEFWLTKKERKQLRKALKNA